VWHDELGGEWVLKGETRRSMAMILSYLASGFAFGLGLLLFTIGSREEWSLIIVLWLAAVVLMFANYRRGYR
jgi:hypothetical protein